MKRSITIFVLVSVMGLGGCSDREVSISETPIKILNDKPGRGRRAESGRTVYIDYEILMPDGKLVLSHKDWRFVMGNNTVVEGMEDAVLGMRVGGRRVVECPPHKHWGRNGYTDKIPPNTFLTFKVRLNRVD